MLHAARQLAVLNYTPPMAALATAILRGKTSAEHLDKILSRGPEVADFSYCDPLGRGLIHLAADSGDVPALRWVLSKGADPRAVTNNREGNTALHLAACEGHREIVSYLLEEASVGVAGVNCSGETALDAALNAGHDDIARIMTRHLRPPPPSPQLNQCGEASASVISDEGSIGAGILRGQGVRKQRQQQQQYQEERVGESDAGAAAAVSTGNGDDHPRSTTAGRQITTAVNEQGRMKDKTEARRHVPDASTPPAATTAAAAAVGSKTGRGSASRTPDATATRVGKGRTPPFDGRGVTGGGFFVAGAWSKAGVCSCFNVRHRHLLGKHGIVFDMGVCPSEVVHVQHVFITHGHLDHCGAIVSHARLRALSQGPPAKYYMHAELAAGMEKVRAAFGEVEGKSIGMDIVAVSPDDTVDLGQGCIVQPFLVKHRVEALGFALMRRRSNGLKPEYRDMDGKAIGTLKKRGVDVALSHQTVEVVYTGDTVMSALVALPQVWKARLLIMEVTYLDGDTGAALKHRHIHVKDVLNNAEKLEGVEQLLVSHVSERHGGHRNILRLLAAALPPSIVNKVSVALGEFGAPQHLTFLEDFVLDNSGAK